MSIRNLDFLRSLPLGVSIQHLGARLYEALSDVDAQHQTVAQQTNSNPTGHPFPPPAIDGLTVTGQNGQFHLQIQHGAEFYRGVSYHAEYADNPAFQNPRSIDLGASREHTVFLGNGTHYWRAFAAYGSSPAGPPAYHGGARSPQPVSGGGSIGGPAFLSPQGSGTGAPGEGISGPGPVAFRTSTGRPPIRGDSTVSGGSSGGSLAHGPSVGLPVGIGAIFGSGGGSANQITVDSRTLAAGANTINPPSGGLLWILFLKTPGAGVATITWGAGIAYASANIDSTISTGSPFVFAFDSASTNWYMIVQGATGMVP